MHEVIHTFTSSEAGKLQGKQQKEKTNEVYEMLRRQDKLKHMIEDYITGHHKETFDMSDV